MNLLIKPNTYSTNMMLCSMENGTWLDMFNHPPVYPAKDRVPLTIYGSLVSNPEYDMESRRPRCIGANVESIYALQLDYDSGMSIKQFTEMYGEYRWSLYTSYSHGYKGTYDRFRVVLPLATPMPCFILNNKRVKNNLVWHFPGVDTCCFDRGHWQCCPAIRSKDSPYYCYQNKGSLWGGEDYWRDYARWVEEDKLEFARRAERAKELTHEVNVDELLLELEGELNAIPVGQGQRYAAVKRLLAKYVHKGVGEAILSVPCPWSDKKWERQWPGLVNWASTIV